MRAESLPVRRARRRRAASLRSVCSSRRCRRSPGRSTRGTASRRRSRHGSSRSSAGCSSSRTQTCGWKKVPRSAGRASREASPPGDRLTAACQSYIAARASLRDLHSPHPNVAPPLPHPLRAGARLEARCAVNGAANCRRARVSCAWPRAAIVPTADAQDEQPPRDRCWSRYHLLNGERLPRHRCIGSQLTH